jgi:sorbitol/mannitol transport system substrate-binding protein
VSSKHQDEAKRFIQWATSKEYIRLVANNYGWTIVPPGTRRSTYEQSEYREAAPFAPLVLEAIMAADPSHPTARPVPYRGIQFVGIPEFPVIGTQVGQQMASALVGDTTVEKALQTAQSTTERTLRRAGYPK